MHGQVVQHMQNPPTSHELSCVLRRSNVSFAFAASGNTSAPAYQCALQAVSSATGQPVGASPTYSACTSPVVCTAVPFAAAAMCPFFTCVSRAMDILLCWPAEPRLSSHNGWTFHAFLCNPNKIYCVVWADVPVVVQGHLPAQRAAGRRRA